MFFMFFFCTHTHIQIDLEWKSNNFPSGDKNNEWMLEQNPIELKVERKKINITMYYLFASAYLVRSIRNYIIHFVWMWKPQVHKCVCVDGYPLLLWQSAQFVDVWLVIGE